MRSWLFFTLLCLSSLLAALWLRSGTDATLLATLDSLFTEFGDRFSNTSRSDPVQAKATGHTPLARPLSSQAGIRSNPLLSPSDHAHGDHEVCGRPRTKARADTDTTIVYKWVDENGQAHLSDTQPQGVIASVLDMGMQKRDFTYQIKADGAAVPAEFPGQLAAGSKRIYDTWHFFLGEEKLRQSRIDVLLISGTERFNAYHAKVSPGSRPVNGFYSMANNQAVVKFDPSNHSRSLATTFHEISHLITASHLGPTPPWLTEALNSAYPGGLQRLESDWRKWLSGKTFQVLQT